MPTTRSRKVFINIPVRDLKKSIDFFTKLGFTFDARFTDETATCMILSEEAFVMLMIEPRFKDFAKKEVGDPRSITMALYALSAESRQEVDEILDTAIEAGGSEVGKAQDHGFMYLRSFYDLDGHHWEVAWMDMTQVPPQG